MKEETEVVTDLNKKGSNKIGLVVRLPNKLRDDFSKVCKLLCQEKSHIIRNFVEAYTYSNDVKREEILKIIHNPNLNYKSSGRLTFKIDSFVATKIKDFCRQEGISINRFMRILIAMIENFDMANYKKYK